MSSGGGKSGKNTTQTDSQQDLPAWIKEPAIRNLQRAEDVQRIEYMPYRGAEIAAFNDTQNLAMNNNLATAKAFGLLDASSTMKAEDMMPTPTTFDGGFKGYSSMPLYDQALAETKAQQPGAIAQYEALFGAPAMAQLNASRNSGGGRGRGGNVPMPSGNPTANFTPNYDTSTWTEKVNGKTLAERHAEQIAANSTVSESDNAYRNVQPKFDYNYTKAPAMDDTADIQAGMTGGLSSRLDSKGYTPMGK
jgi:hypothetical protein